MGGRSPQEVSFPYFLDCFGPIAKSQLGSQNRCSTSEALPQGPINCPGNQERGGPFEISGKRAAMVKGES